MLDEQQTIESDSLEGTNEGQDDAMSDNTSGGSDHTSDPTVEALKILSETTGRTYKDLEDARKHINNLNKFVGNPNLRENAELFDAVVNQYANEQNITPREAKEHLKGLVGGQKNYAQNSESKLSPEVETKLAELERDAFLSKNPEAEPYVNKVQEYANLKKMSIKDAYNELYGDVLQAMKENSALDANRQAKRGAQVMASSNGTAPKGPSKSEKLLAEYAKTGDEAIMLEAIKLRKQESAKDE